MDGPKTKEIIFWKSGKVSKILKIQTIPQIERVGVTPPPRQIEH